MTEAMVIARDPDGKFALGNKGGPGRPPAVKEYKYLKAMGTVVTVEHWIEITERARDDAIEGDYRARDWLTKYLVGPPMFAMGAEMEEREDPQTGEKITRLAMVMRSLVDMMNE